MKTKNHIKSHIFAVFLPAFAISVMAGCVSVNIGQSQTERSQKVRAEAPASPFKKQDSSNADQSWQSEKTGNTISYFSECAESSASLEFLATEFGSILQNAKVINSSTRFYNGREAFESVTEGRLDGIPMKISSLVFKKNGCSYLISYVARTDRFNTDEASFKTFIEKFQAP